MDLIRNWIAQFHKCTQKSDKTTDRQKSEHSFGNSSLKQPNNITSNIVEGNSVETNVTSKSVASNEKKINNLNTETVISTDSRNTKENYQESTFDINEIENCNKNTSDLSLVQLPVCDKNVLVNSDDQEIDSKNGQFHNTTEHNGLDEVIDNNINENFDKHALDASLLEQLSSKSISVRKIKSESQKNYSDSEHSSVIKNNNGCQVVEGVINKNASELSLLQQLYSDASVTVTVDEGNVQKEYSDDKRNKIIQKNIINREDVRSDIKSVNAIANNGKRDDEIETVAPIIDSYNLNDFINYPNHITPTVIIAELTTDKDIAEYSTNENNKYSEFDTINKLQIKDNDETSKCIEEFENVLADVQSKNNKSNVNESEDFSLELIGEILSEELEDNNTYNFQDIKHVNSESKEMENMDYGPIFEGDLLETVLMKLHKEIATKVVVEDNVSVISISSEDSPDPDAQNVTDVNLNITTKCDIKGDPSIFSDVIKNVKTKIQKSISLCSGSPNIDTKDTLTVEMNIEQDFKESTKPTSSPVINHIETVTITEDLKSDADDDCGYHSSDFEFITEEEAKADGLLINFNHKRHIANHNLKAPANKNNNISNNSCRDTSRVQNDLYGPGPSSRNPGRFEQYRERILLASQRWRENYAIPNENEFSNMFHGHIPNLPVSEIHFLENKSVRTRAPMLVQYEGMGFDMRLMMQRRHSSDEEYREEAEETRYKISAMYPQENKQRKRRRRR